MTTNSLVSLILPLAGMILAALIFLALSNGLRNRAREFGELSIAARQRPRVKISPAARGSILIIGVIWYALNSWLRYKTGWPGEYGFNCFARCSLEDNLAYSFALLHRGPLELALFLTMWAVPIGLLAYGLWLLRKWVIGEDSDASGDQQ